MRYYKNKTQKIYNQSPDVSLIMYNKDGNIIDRLEFYGDLAEYKGIQ